MADFKHCHDKAIIYIGGYGRSGSTLLDAYLSSSDGVFGLGECINFFDAACEADVCECGKMLKECSFWAGFFQEYPNDLLFSYSKITSNFDSLGEKSFSGKEYDFFWGKLFEYARSKSSSDVLVDSSKTTRKTFWRPKNIRCIGESVFFIYLYKDPMDLLISLKKGSNKYLSGRNSSSYSFKFLIKSFFGWIVGNFGAVIASRYLGKNRVVVLNYKDFANAPAVIFKRLSKMGVTLSPPDSFENGHGISGNRVRSSINKIYYRQPDDLPLNISERLILFMMNMLLPVFIFLSGGKRNTGEMHR